MSLTSRISQLIFLAISHPEQTCTPKPRPERHARRPRPQQAISESGYRQHVAGYLSNPNESGYRQRVAGYLSNPNESGYRQPEGWLPLQSPEKWISSTRLLVTSPFQSHPPRGFLYQFSSKSFAWYTHTPEPTQYL